MCCKEHHQHNQPQRDETIQDKTENQGLLRAYGLELADVLEGVGQEQSEPGPAVSYLLIEIGPH